MKIILFIAAFICTIPAGELKLDATKSSLKITGTSSLHDWEMTVDEYDITGAAEGNSIQNLKVAVVSKSMKSGKSVMDNKAYDAVQSDGHPEIIFRATNLQITGDQILGKGTLTIAGESREKEFQAKIITNAPNAMHLQGVMPLKMSDFDIRAPTAMFGTLKTGDDVQIHFDIYINK